MKRNYHYMSKLEYYFDFGAAPAMVIAPFLFGQLRLNWWLAGLVLWTLVEYFVHREIFHVSYRREHWVHHINPDAYVGVGSYITTIAMAVMLVIALYIGVGAFYSGFVFGYWLYIVVHDAIHHDSVLSPYLGGLRRNHELHHRTGAPINFGVTTSLWDHVFGTRGRVLPKSDDHA